MILYRLFRLVFRAAMQVFFSRIELEGIDNVPEAGPVLLVPNHTNALVDGLVVGCCLRRPVVMTAKTTLADNPVLAFMMRAANVVTLQRREDARNDREMAKNEDAFGRLLELLAAGQAVCLFPEGKSHSDPGLRPFRTGAARLAMTFVDGEQADKSLPIVPVGIHYQRKSRFRSRAWIGFGEPLDVRAWRRRNPQGDVRALTARLRERVKALTLSFDQRSRSETLLAAADLLSTGGEAPPELGLRPIPRVAEQLRLVHALQNGRARLMAIEPQSVAVLEQRVVAHRALLRQLAVAPHELFLPMHAGRAAFFVLRELELVLLGLPLALWGLINHLLPALLTGSLARKMTRDEDQFATNVIFVSVFLFPLFYSIQTAVAAQFLSAGWLLLYMISVPYCGAYAVSWFDRVRGAYRRSRTYLLWRSRPDLQRALAREGRDILSEIRRLNDLLEAGHGSAA
jgi:glycerol-3-phosphate O-acyltransferase / dihydroxyacetone phosphate acyltransferase